MLLLGIAWIYVVAMIAIVELTGADASWLRAVSTLLLWGVLPLGIVAYLGLAPARRRRRREAENAQAVRSALDPDGRSHAPGDAVAPEREVP